MNVVLHFQWLDFQVLISSSELFPLNEGLSINFASPRRTSNASIILVPQIFTIASSLPHINRKGQVILRPSPREVRSCVASEGKHDEYPGPEMRIQAES